MKLAILQARTSSKRLPGKVLKPIAGAPMLFRQIERIRRSRHIEQLVVATSSRAEDDAIERVSADAGAACYRGSLDDVLDRFYKAALPYSPHHVVRLTGDNPLADWDVIDRVIEFSVAGDYDYGSNVLEPTWPDGLDVEVVKFNALETAWRDSTDALDREHVTPFIYKQPERFKLGNLKHKFDLSALRWTVDEEKDFEFVRLVYEALWRENQRFQTDDILRLLGQRPDLQGLNSEYQRNAGYLRALADQASGGKS